MKFIWFIIVLSLLSTIKESSTYLFSCFWFLLWKLRSFWVWLSSYFVPSCSLLYFFIVTFFLTYAVFFTLFSLKSTNTLIRVFTILYFLTFTTYVTWNFFSFFFIFLYLFFYWLSIWEFFYFSFFFTALLIFSLL